MASFFLLFFIGKLGYFGNYLIQGLSFKYSFRFLALINTKINRQFYRGSQNHNLSYISISLKDITLQRHTHFIKLRHNKWFSSNCIIKSLPTVTQGLFSSSDSWIKPIAQG